MLASGGLGRRYIGALAQEETTGVSVTSVQKKKPTAAEFPLQGLALINGTQMITSMGAEAVERAQSIARQADIIAALTLEVLKGTTKAFDSGERLQQKEQTKSKTPNLM